MKPLRFDIYPEGRMEVYRALVAELELEADAIKSRLTVIPYSGPSSYNPDRHYFEGKSAATSYALRLIHHHFRHDYARGDTDNSQCAICGQDRTHEVHMKAQ